MPGGTALVSATFNATAASLEPGMYADSLVFTNSFNAVGNTSRSASLTVVLPAPVLTTIPPIRSGTSYNLGWNAVFGATYYEAQQDTTQGFTAPLTSGSLAATNHAFNGFVDGTAYYYRARAVRVSTSLFQSNWSPISSTLQDNTSPSVAISPPTVTLRTSTVLSGTAFDTSGILDVTVNGVLASSTDAFMHWSGTSCKPAKWHECRHNCRPR